MKTESRFKLDQHIRMGLRLLAKQKGLDLDAMVNSLLSEAISGCSDCKVISTHEFCAWAQQNLPLEEKIRMNEYWELFLSHNPGQICWVNKFQFGKLVEDYCLEKYLYLKHGKDFNGRYIILSKKEIIPPEGRKPINKQEFFTWADKNKISQGKIIRKELYKLFLADHKERKYLSQKEFFAWIYEYGKFIGYSILDGGTGSGQWVMMLLSHPKIETKKIAVVEKDDFGD